MKSKAAAHLKVTAIHLKATATHLKAATHLRVAIALFTIALLTMAFLITQPTYAKTTTRLNITHTSSKATTHSNNKKQKNKHKNKKNKHKNKKYKNRVKIQTKIYQKELNTKLHRNTYNTHGTPLNTVLNRVLQGKIGYVGKYEERKPMINQINQMAGTKLTTIRFIEINRAQSYYKQFLNIPGNPDNSCKDMQKRRIGNTLCYLTLSSTKGDTVKSRSRYWALAKKAVRKVGVHNGDTDKVAVHKIAMWICKHTKYKEGNYDNSEAGTLFKKGTGVCRDYSDAFWSMCKICNIPCKYYTGYANGFHGWNRVKVSGTWYWIDVTWMDNRTIDKRYYLKRRLWNNHKSPKSTFKSILSCGTTTTH